MVKFTKAALREDIEQQIKDLPNRIQKDLSSLSRQIIGSFLGINIDHWGEVRLNLYTRTPLTDELNRVIAEKIKTLGNDFFEQLVSKPNIKLIRSLRSLYKEAYAAELSKLVTRMAEKHAAEEAEKYLQEVIESVKTDLFEKDEKKPDA